MIESLFQKKKEKEKEEREYFLCKNLKIIENEKEKDLAIRRWINPNKKDFSFKLIIIQNEQRWKSIYSIS